VEETHHAQGTVMLHNSFVLLGTQITVMRIT